MRYARSTLYDLSHLDLIPPYKERLVVLKLYEPNTRGDRTLYISKPFHWSIQKVLQVANLQGTIVKCDYRSSFIFIEYATKQQADKARRSISLYEGLKCEIAKNPIRSKGKALPPSTLHKGCLADRFPCSGVPAWIK